MWDLEALKSEYKKHVPEVLFEHNLRVTKLAGELAEKFGADRDRAEVTGLVHDIAFPRDEELVPLAEQYGVRITPVERNAPILLHGPVGAHLITKFLGLSDEDICEAVRWHTTGRENASELEKIVFLSDKMDVTSDDDGHLSEIKEALEESLDKAVLVCVNQIIPYQLQQGFALHPDLVAMRNEIILKSKVK